MAQSELLTPHEFANALRVSLACVRRWLLLRRIASVRVGRLVRIPADEVRRIINAGTVPARTSERGNNQ